MMRRALGSAAAVVGAHPVASFFVIFLVFPWVVPYRSLATQEIGRASCRERV